jgi:hypothetical protein
LLDGGGGSGSGSGSGRKSVESINSKNKGKVSSIQLASSNILNPSAYSAAVGGGGDVNSGRKNNPSLKIPVVSIGGVGGGGNAVNRSQSSSIGDLGSSLSHLSRSMDSLPGHPVSYNNTHAVNNNISNLSTSRSSNASSSKLYQLDGKTAEEKIAELMNLNLQEIKSTETSEAGGGVGGGGVGKKDLHGSTISLALSNQSSIASSQSQNKRNNLPNKKR